MHCLSMHESCGTVHTAHALCTVDFSVLDSEQSICRSEL